MSTRPRRSAATKAKETISVHAQWANTSDKRDPDPKPTMSSRRSSRVVHDDPDSAEDSHLDVTVKVGSGKLRQVTRGTGRRSDPFEGGEIVHGKRDRGGKKKYVVDSSPDDDEEEEEEEEEAQIDDDEDDDMEDADEDAEGEDDMEVDAEGEDVNAEGEEEEDDAEGDVDMDTPARPGPTIKISRSSNTKPPRANAARVVADDGDDDDDDDDDDDELSDPADSDAGDQTLGLGDGGDDGDGEREEIRVAAGEQDLDSDEDASGEEEEPDLTKMTKRQRARFEDTEQAFMKLSDGEYCWCRLGDGAEDADNQVQRCRQRRFSLPRNYPCAGKRWHGAGGT